MAPRFGSLPFGLRFALRDLLGDPRGFGVFIACIVIGVAAIWTMLKIIGPVIAGFSIEHFGFALACLCLSAVAATPILLLAVRGEGLHGGTQHHHAVSGV